MHDGGASAIEKNHAVSVVLVMDVICMVLVSEKNHALSSLPMLKLHVICITDGGARCY